MASIFDKMNARLPALLRPGSRLRTKAASVKPLVGIKKFALKTVMLAKQLKVLIPRQLRNFASNVYTPKATLRSKLGADVDSALHSRSIRRVDSNTLLEQFKQKGEKYGTEAAKREAKELMDAFVKLQPALEAFISGADARTDRYQQKLTAIEQEFTQGIEHLKDIAWEDMLAFLEGASSEEVTQYQSLHQLVYGTSHVDTGSDVRLNGLKQTVQEINENPGLRREGETTFEAALRIMRTEWSKHKRTVKQQLRTWEDNKDITSARKYQHHLAFLESVESLERMINEPNQDIAREARQHFLGKYGELFGVQGRMPAAAKHLKGLRDADSGSETNSGNDTDSDEDEFYETQTSAEGLGSGDETSGVETETDADAAPKAKKAPKQSGLRRRKKSSIKERNERYNRRAGNKGVSGQTGLDSD
ncbi:hypothetical protein [Endozoicomonas lisbonensis]|uniref:Cell fate (Sporulation/competence/biofilm development) regulator YlbF (YheA/YmcA/DUF963 family) n=1 Tax=Endozoicomonas lisbonensis TaxID=3120522 RepID=A0ABV2SL43_9GAMM